MRLSYLNDKSLHKISISCMIGVIISILDCTSAIASLQNLEEDLERLSIHYNSTEPEKAELYLKAARGDSKAQVELGELYVQRKVILKENEDADKIAYTLFLKAAEQNNLDGLFNVAECLDDGRGVKQDKRKACYYFSSYYRMKQ